MKTSVPLCLFLFVLFICSLIVSNTEAGKCKEKCAFCCRRWVRRRVRRKGEKGNGKRSSAANREPFFFQESRNAVAGEESLLGENQ
ncbi:hypothetical protein OS493_036866 [Desmophyllum pertusum]|uniref:Uncharacterized protein n=1 Tax=Desmophyllum pertusum TaxID=174260 RepID=A0A9W9Z6V0_9CNID|nr:hypothetical protein OS493_036866 [Desmophyllum pertusum]